MNARQVAQFAAVKRLLATLLTPQLTRLLLAGTLCALSLIISLSLGCLLCSLASNMHLNQLLASYA